MTGAHHPQAKAHRRRAGRHLAFKRRRPGGSLPVPIMVMVVPIGVMMAVAAVVPVAVVAAVMAVAVGLRQRRHEQQRERESGNGGFQWRVPFGVAELRTSQENQFADV